MSAPHSKPLPGLRKIIHVDMDAFYASVEQRDNPALRGRPVAVGGSSKRGVVAAASYEARKFGVRSAMPSVTAARQCPDLIFVKPRFDVYRAVSQQIRAIFHEVADAVEPLSLDEAYLDVSSDKGGFGSATATARHIRARIREVTGLTASAGVSTNKLIAKLASDQNKPDGLTIVPPGQEAAFVQTLSVRRLHGVGPVTAGRLEAMGLHSVASLAACPREELAKEFKSSADWLLAMAHGIDERPVREDRQRKSLGAERTFETDLTEPEELHRALAMINDAVWERSERGGDGPARTVTLKLKFADFRQITRSRTTEQTVHDRATLDRLSAELLDAELPPPLGIRLMGVTLSGFAVQEAEPVEDLPLFAGA
ncbi:DNA polymerase IV [Sphingomonas lacunae]|uniref:DNA polymerase IV n=1 Tax=Sphingomonas lacunae TaxID=2698828 RepID=A0A6M4AY15_9SPHN|nr:DNA polymerase IV [Sphingomonas lacunae]QJQ33250.1 DNA polymerase IV [Sphingomonas lacunae]